VGAGLAIASHAAPALRLPVLTAVQSAFMSGLHAGCFVAAGVCAAGALGALALPGRLRIASSGDGPGNGGNVAPLTTGACPSGPGDGASLVATLPG
jgi:hypothetical protein